MGNCTEYVLDDLMAITAIPLADIPPGNPGSPANSLAPSIAKAEFRPTLARAVTIGRVPLDLTVQGGTVNRSAFLVPIKRMTGKAKDNEGDSVAGRLHTVSVNCEVDDRNPVAGTSGKTLLDYLLALERTPSHLVLTFRDGTTMGFVSATQDAYLCNVERDGSKTTVAFRIQNLMGIQLLV